MKIAGVQKTSLIDYPNQIASVIFTQGCNLRCPYCHNPGLISEPSHEEDYLTPKQLWSFLANRKGLIDGVVITGGEPTLQPDLQPTIKKINQLGLKVKLDTNGSQPDVLNSLLKEKLINYVALDIKSPVTDYHQFNGQNLSKSVKKSIQLIQQSPIKSEFRTTVVPGLHTAEDIEQISQQIAGAEHYYLQNFKPTSTLDPDLEEKTEFPPAKLEEFKQIASNYVQKTKIRN